MLIAKFAASAGISASAVRYYERLGLLPTPARRGGKREYAASDVARLKAIVAARQAGFDMRALKTLRGALENRPALRAIIIAKVQRNEQQIARLNAENRALATLRDCTCADVVACASRLAVHP